MSGFFSSNFVKSPMIKIFQPQTNYKNLFHLGASRAWSSHSCVAQFPLYKSDPIDRLSWIRKIKGAKYHQRVVVDKWLSDYRVSQKRYTYRTKSHPKLSDMGLNFPIDMTWGRLILLSLSEKWPKKKSPDTRGAGKWWLSHCTVAPAVFW